MANIFLKPKPLNWLILIICFSTVIACNNKKEVVKTNNAEISQNSNLKAATIFDYTEKEKGCGFIIQLDETGDILQALEIPEKLRKDGTKILIDYTPSRRQQGPCPLGIPININEIKKIN